MSEKVTSENAASENAENTPSDRVTVEADVVYGIGGGRDLHCDIYWPPGSSPDQPGEGRPCVILVHGGAWRTGDRSQLRGYGIRLGRAGYLSVAIEYRLTPESPWPAQIHDVKAAVRWVRANADRLGIDPERIALEGNSAGAHLALLAAGTATVAEFDGEGGNPGVDSTVGAVIAIYPPVLFGHRERLVGAVPLAALVEDPPAGSDATATARMASPLTFVSPDFPSTMLVHGTHDELVPAKGSLMFHEALLEAEVPTELHVYAGQPHAFDALPAFGRQVAAEMVLFLGRYLRKPNQVSNKPQLT